MKNIEKEKPTKKTIISTIVNIAEYKKGEEYIRHLASIVESSDDAIISKSLDGIIKSWNKGSEKMFGYTEKEAVGKHIYLIFPLAQIKEEKLIHERILNNEIIDHYETIRIKKNGQLVYVSITLSPLKNQAGKIIGISKIARDITSNKKYETELIQANVKFALQNEEKKKRAAELIIANKELVFQNEEKENRAEELVIANKELAFQNNEKGKRAAELIIANKELVFQNEEKENRAEELVIANKELAFQNNEKGKRAAELIIANKELVFQNEEKENRAEELVIANKELAFQNNEKGKRAAELIIANKELVFQNEEKENRAEELVIANKELAFQNNEKGKRAAELIIANKELVFQNEEKEKRTLLITRMKVVEEQNQILTENLSVHNKKLANFAHITSHNLRSPVANLNSLFSIYKETQNETEKEDILEKFGRVILHLTSTLDDLCESLKISEAVDKNREFLAFEDTLVKTKEILTGQLLETKAELTSDFSKAPRIHFPHIYLESIFLNLLSNSIKYRSPDRIPKIHFETNDTNGVIMLFVKDNGIGIDLKKNGDKLFGLHKVFNRNKDAKGVGLFLTKTQIEAMGGTIAAESEINNGILFKICFNIQNT